MIEKNGNAAVTEDMFKINNGYKPKRFADVVEYKNGDIVAIYQIGKINKNGLPVSRESKAIADIMTSSKYNGVPIFFVPYNREIEPLIYMR